jgi:hypothetical protein
MESGKGIKQLDVDDAKTTASLTERYLASLTPKQYKSYSIAKDHLGMSFQIEKSNGFLAWLKRNG